MRRVVIACLFVVACARVPSARAPGSAAVGVASTVPSATPLPSCARRTSGALPSRASLARQGSAVALVHARGGLLAYVADADSRSVHTVDVDARRELGRTFVVGEPRELLVLPDGRVAATLSDGTHLVVLEPDADPARPLVRLCDREVPAEPWGLALSPDDATLVVTSGWGSALTVLDAASLEPRRVVPLPREPRGVLVDDDGVVLVSHLLGAKTSAVRLDQDGAPETVGLAARVASPLAQQEDRLAERTGSQGYALVSVALPVAAGQPAASRILFPMVSVDPGAPERRSTYYGADLAGLAKESPMVSALDPGTLRPLSPYLLAASNKTFTRECLLPRAAAVYAGARGGAPGLPGAGPARAGAGPTLLVACQGIDAVLELDALAADPFRAERRRFAVPPGPQGIAVDDATGRAVVFSQLGAALTVLDVGAAARPTVAADRIALDYHPAPELASPEVMRGRQLFYRTDDTRITQDGLGCASCHVDGREDGITWNTPMGPRQTPMLAGRLGATAPYGWEGDRGTVAEYITNTVSRLGGQGIRPQDVSDLSAYLDALEIPPAFALPVATVARGRALFESAATDCSTCHVGGGTDSAVHALATTGKVDTPSLRFVVGTAPYFHDGRYATLEELLSDSSSHMGSSAGLPGADRDALAAYLRSL